METTIINLISGPGSGKTTLAAQIFYELKKRREIVEYVQEYAKTLVWLKDFDTLNNQYFVTKKQAELFSKITGNVKYIVTDACLLHGLYYNRTNPDNVSNIEKTEKFIIDSYHKFTNINIFLERGELPYEQAGRIQNYLEALEADKELKKLLKEFQIPYKSFNCQAPIREILDFILSHKNYKFNINSI